jgi:hypothetical protein
MNRGAEEKLCVAKHELPHWNVCLPHYYDNMCKHYNAWRHNNKKKQACGARNNMQGEPAAGGNADHRRMETSRC